MGLRLHGQRLQLMGFPLRTATLLLVALDMLERNVGLGDHGTAGRVRWEHGGSRLHRLLILLMHVLILDRRLCDIILFDQLADIDELGIRARPDALDGLSSHGALFSSR